MFLSLALFWGCHQADKQNAESTTTQKADSDKTAAGSSLTAIITANMNKLPMVDTTFLGFTFSMSQKQAIDRMVELIKEKKLVKDDSTELFEYALNFDSVKAKTGIAPEFYNDKLYKLSLIITAADETTTPDAVFTQAADAYSKKYSGKGFVSYQEQDPTDPTIKMYHWIKNNLHISLRKGPDGTMVSYINTPAAQLVKKKEQIKADSSKTETNKDI